MIPPVVERGGTRARCVRSGLEHGEQRVSSTALRVFCCNGPSSRNRSSSRACHEPSGSQVPPRKRSPARLHRLGVCSRATGPEPSIGACPSAAGRGQRDAAQGVRRHATPRRRRLLVLLASARAEQRHHCVRLRTLPAHPGSLRPRTRRARREGAQRCVAGRRECPRSVDRGHLCVCAAPTRLVHDPRARGRHEARLYGLWRLRQDQPAVVLHRDERGLCGGCRPLEESVPVQRLRGEVLTAGTLG